MNIKKYSLGDLASIVAESDDEQVLKSFVIVSQYLVKIQALEAELEKELSNELEQDWDDLLGYDDAQEVLI